MWTNLQIGEVNRRLRRVRIGAAFMAFEECDLRYSAVSVLRRTARVPRLSAEECRVDMHGNAVARITKISASCEPLITLPPSEYREVGVVIDGKVAAMIQGGEETVPAVVAERLTVSAFEQLSGVLAGHPYVKLVVDRQHDTIHFINNDRYQFHAHYIAERLLGMTTADLERDVDTFNRNFYQDADRRFYLGILALHARRDTHTGQDRRFFSLETTEADTMSAGMMSYFYEFVREHLDPALPLYFKPATHLQESSLAAIPPAELPRVSAHELFSSAQFVPLNAGTARGRLRAFRSEREYRNTTVPLEWDDIIVMERVPDDIPRLAGIINARHTTPLSHTNVLATGWQIPNAIQLGVLDRIEADGLDGEWVEYRVAMDAAEVSLARIERPAELTQPPAWRAQQITLEEPEVAETPIARLDQLRMSDRYRYGTKAANLGELHHVLGHGSSRLTGFYQVPRPPRANLLGYLTGLLGVSEHADPAAPALRLLRQHVRVPRGIALPFSVQQRFLESSPRIQQAIGKLKMALELDAREIDPLCLSLQQLIRGTRLPEDMREHIDAAIVRHLGGVRSFVVRSSSNAEDLDGFSAAGIYESINHVTTADRIFHSIKEVWASLCSPRSVRLRQQAGISLDDCYMGVIVQEQVEAAMGGVLVTTNPMNRADFRNVYVNVSPGSVVDIVSGIGSPMQYLFNTVEGGGRTLSLGDAGRDLDDAAKESLQRLALVGRLLQSHFSPDYTFSAPVDIEWVADGDTVYIVQLRPYST
jgi:hypothetical protein